jgi:hypothetical protein
MIIFVGGMEKWKAWKDGRDVEWKDGRSYSSFPNLKYPFIQSSIPPTIKQFKNLTK